MYCSSRSSLDVVFGFVFPAKFPAYKLLPPLCLVSIPRYPPPPFWYIVAANSHPLAFNSFSTPHPLVPPVANDSRSYGFLSLINYRVALGACCDLGAPFFPPASALRPQSVLPDGPPAFLAFCGRRHRVTMAENGAGDCKRALGRCAIS